MNSLRTAQFIDTFYPHIDGVVRTVDQYASRLAGEGCTVFAPRARAYRAQAEDDFPYEVVRTQELRLPFVDYGYPLPEFSAGLKAKIETGGYALFHAHSPFMLGRYAVRLGRELGVPVVATFHSKYYDDFQRVTGSKKLAATVTRGIVRFYESADAVWTVSPGAAATLRGYGYRGEITVIPNGTDRSPLPDREERVRAAREKFQLPADKHLLLYVGQMVWQKNLRQVLDSFRLLCRESDEYRLVMVGSGFYEKQIRDYAGELLESGRVLFTGRIADPTELKAVYSACDLFFFPSLYDTFSLVVREAAAMELPSLLVRGADAADGVIDGENGYLEENDAARLAAKIRRIFADEAALRAAGVRAAQTLPVSWDEVLERVKAQYARVIEDYGRNQTH